MKFTESASRSTCLAGGRFVASAAFSPASLPGEEAYRDVRRHPEAVTFPGLLIWRAGGDLFFASIGHVNLWRYWRRARLLRQVVRRAA